jgi:hypothetical protein
VEKGLGKDMKRKGTVVILCAMLFPLCFAVWAQQPAGKVHRIGFLLSNSRSSM